MSNKKNEHISEDALCKILYHAMQETDVIIKSSIIIQCLIGLRTSEVLGLKKGCINTTNEGQAYLEFAIKKPEESVPKVNKVFISELVKNTIEELEKSTEKLREKSGLENLFLIENRVGVKALNYIVYAKRLNKFVEKWDIKDDEGNLYDLKSHKLRATYLNRIEQRILMKDGVFFITKNK